MAHIFEYSVLRAIPDPRRGECVNVGIVIFSDDEVDIRFPGRGKLRVIASDDWGSYLTNFEGALHRAYEKIKNPEACLASVAELGGAISPTTLARFSVFSLEDYEQRVNEIINTLVLKPALPRKGRGGSTRINTEITREFRRVNILASREESIDDHKVVRNFVVSQEEDLVADFALKNGVYHITATLDLRLARVNIGQAAIKAIVLDKAAKEFGEVRRIGVYAVDSHAPQYRSHIALLQDYADDTFNWLDSHDRMEFTRLIYDALPPLGHLQSSN